MPHSPSRRIADIGNSYSVCRVASATSNASNQENAGILFASKFKWLTPPFEFSTGERTVYRTENGDLNNVRFAHYSLASPMTVLASCYSAVRVKDRLQNEKIEGS